MERLQYSAGSSKRFGDANGKGWIRLHPGELLQHLYIGVTSEIEIRIAKHKNGIYPGSFTAKYKIDRLVYFERYGDVRDAISREKQLKRWSRSKKIALIVASNPDWRDLSREWGQPAEAWDGTVREPEGF